MIRKSRTVQIVHDRIPYLWKDVPVVKYKNWEAMEKQVYDTTDFSSSAFPYMLQVEPSNMCNLSCPLCPNGRKELGRKPRLLEFEEFKALVDDMEPYLLFLVLWDWGEPFLNPALPQMIRYASVRGIKTVTSTNAHFLNDNYYLEEILSSGLSTLIVAIDSVDENNYSVYRKKGDLKKAKEGLRGLIEKKHSMGSKTLINMRMVIMKHNAYELESIRQLSRRLKADSFTVKTVLPGHGVCSMDEEVVPENPKYRRYRYKDGTYERIRIRSFCERIWKWADIYSNGDVVRCCYDYSAELKLGNIKEKPFTEIWNSPGYRNLRRKIFEDKNSIPACRECTINFELEGSDWFVGLDGQKKRNHVGLRRRIWKGVKSLLPKKTVHWIQAARKK